MSRPGFFALLIGLSVAAVAGYIALFFQIALNVSVRAKAGLRGLDHFCNATLFGGSPYETVSSHVGRLTAAPGAPWWATVLYFVLNLADPGHCERAAADEAPILAALAALQTNQEH